MGCVGACECNRVPFIDRHCTKNYTCLAITLFLLRKDENCYPQVFLKECKYIGKKATRYIADDFKSSSDDSDYSEKE